jgi:HEAT repeat protein
VLVSTFVLGWFAIGQGVFVALLLVTLILGRAFRAWHRERTRRETEELVRAAHRWLLRKEGEQRFIDAVEAADFEVVLETLQRLSSQVTGDRWEHLVNDLRDTTWFRGVQTRAKSRLWWRRLAAANAFVIVAMPEDLTVLEVLIADPNRMVQLATVAVLKRLQSAPLVERTLEIAGASRSVARRYPLEVLASAPGLDLRIVSDRMARPRDPLELRSLLDLVGELGVPSFLEPVLKHVDSPDLEVRIAVARTLGQFPHPSSNIALLTFLDDPDWQVRAQAAAGIGAIGDRRLAAELSRALRDPNWWVRLRSALSLRRLGELGLRVLRAVPADEDRYAYEMAQYVLGLDDAAVAEYSGPSVVDFTEVAGAAALAA